MQKRIEIKLKNMSLRGKKTTVYEMTDIAVEWNGAWT